MKDINDYLAIDSSSPTGLVWKINNGKMKAGSPALTYVDGGGYYTGTFNYKFQLAHRVVFFLHNGRMPDGEVDHMDGNRQNNKPSNLREVSRSHNQHNRKTAKGYHFDKRAKKYHATIRSPKAGKIHLGLFEREEDARSAYLRAKEKIHAGWIAPKDIK